MTQQKRRTSHPFTWPIRLCWRAEYRSALAAGTRRLEWSESLQSRLSHVSSTCLRVHATETSHPTKEEEKKHLTFFLCIFFFAGKQWRELTHIIDSGYRPRPTTSATLPPTCTCAPWRRRALPETIATEFDPTVHSRTLYVCVR